MILLIPLIATAIVILVFWLTAPARHMSSADKYFEEGKISKAAKELKKVWKRRDDIPARLAEMYFVLVKKEKLQYVFKALSIDTEGISDDAKQNLIAVQKDIVHYIEGKSSAAFAAENYSDAIKYNATLKKFDDQYKVKDTEYQIFMELKDFLLNGHTGKTLSTCLEKNKYLVVLCIKRRINEIESLHDILKLLSLALDNDDIQHLFEDHVLKFVLQYKELPELHSHADKYQQTYLETLADNMPESNIMDALTIYKALYSRKPRLCISEKIETLNYKRACAFIEKGSYNKFRQLQTALNQNTDVTPGFRSDLACKYNILLFDYLSKRILSKDLEDNKWNDYLRCCAEYAASVRPEEVLKIAQNLNSRGIYARSCKLCSMLNESDPEVVELICANVIGLLDKSTEYESLADVYNCIEVLPKVADRCFEHAKDLGEAGNYAKAVYIEKLAEPYFSGDDSKYDVFITHYIVYAMSFSPEQISAELDEIFRYLLKISDVSTINKHLIVLEEHASSMLSRGKAAEAYEISKRIFLKSNQASRVFLDSALVLAQRGKLKDLHGLSEAMTMQDDPLAETLKFIPFFPDELRQPYIVGYAKRVSDLYEKNPDAAVDFFQEQSDLTLREKILVEISKNNAEAFHAIVLDVLNDKQNKLPKETSYAVVFIGLVYKKASKADKVILLKDLVISGYDAKTYYVKAVICSINDLKSLEEKLDAVNEALSVTEDQKLYDEKHKIAVLYIESNPQKALAICTEIASNVNVTGTKLECYIKLAEEADSLVEKHSYLTAANQLCDKSNKKKYAEIVSIALALAASLFVSCKPENAYAIYDEFPALATDLAYAEHKIDEIKLISGDASAVKELKNLLDRCEGSTYANEIHSSETYCNLWKEYVKRTLSKANKQNSEKAIESLIAVAKEVKEAPFDNIQLHKTLTDKIAELSYTLAHELEESHEYSSAIKYYELSAQYSSLPANAAGRRVICLLKQNTIPAITLMNDVQNALSIVSRDIEKDIVYRHVLRLLSEGYANEAAQLAKERLRDNKLIDLCESYRARKAKAHIDELNEQIALIREQKATYSEAKALYDSLESRLAPIIMVFPEHRHLLTEYKNGIFTYLLKAAQKEEKYEVLFQQYSTDIPDFMKDHSKFRNIAAVCLGMMEQGCLNTSNYKQVISIWLTAVYNDYLIIRSLDHTKWDDPYTFTLDDSLSHSYGYDNLPDNINYDASGESNVSIRNVQKSLLERSDAALSNGPKKYYDFYLEQRKAMDAYAELKSDKHSCCDSQENIIAPYAITKILPVQYRKRMKGSLNAGKTELGYRIGHMYGFTDKVYAEYANAAAYYDECISSARSLAGTGEAFQTRKVADISKFSSLYAQLVSELTNILNEHISNDKTYKQILAPFATICKQINDAILSNNYSKFINTQVIQLVNNKTLSTKDGLKIIYEIYTIYRHNQNIRNNISGMLISLIHDYILSSSTEGWGIISKILNDTNDFNDDIIKSLQNSQLAIIILLKDNESRLHDVLNIIADNDASMSSKVASVKASVENAKLQKELGEIIKKCNNNEISNLDALQKIYAIYKKNSSDSRTCDNLAIIANKCILEYIAGNKTGVYAVRRILDELFLNRSLMFKSKRSIFREALNDLKSNLPADIHSLLGLNDSPVAKILSQGQTLNEEGKRLKSAIDYIKKFAND